MKLMLRRARAGDFGELALLVKGFWLNLKDTTKADFRRAFRRELKEKNTIRFLLFGDGKLIGCLSLVRYWIAHSRGYQIILEEIVINKRYQRKGYGLKLLDYAIKYARKQKARELWLETGARNAAQKFYEKRLARAGVAVYRLKFA